MKTAYSREFHRGRNAVPARECEWHLGMAPREAPVGFPSRVEVWSMASHVYKGKAIVAKHVSLTGKRVDREGPPSFMAALSPREARELAQALLRSADVVEASE